MFEPQEGQIGTPRRSMIRSCGCAVLGAASTLNRPHLAFSRQKQLQPLNRYPRMMQRSLVEQVRLAQKRGVQEKWALETKSEAEAYVRAVRKKISACFGPRPTKTALKAEITGTLFRENYRVEKVIFHSRPDFPVTANLYLPTVGKKVPGVVGTCGHSTNGKAAEAYQSFASGLARLGLACLIYDPIGQGERLQYVTTSGRSKIGVGVQEHIQCGNQQYLVGENFAMWRAWDGIRALDYLLTRPEIDPAHIGVTGNSGGGTMTTWLCGLDQRWTMAAPSCFVTTFLRNAENELPADTEQCPPRVLAEGLDHEDFLIAMAPKPITILAKEKDFFDVRGTEEAYERIRRVYRLMGAEENVNLFVGPTEHGFSQENRTAMYNCFLKAVGQEAISIEPRITLEKESDLWCTASGQVSERKPETVFSFTRGKAEQLSKRRPAATGRDLETRIRKILRLEAKVETEQSLPTPAVRILRDFGDRGFPWPHTTAYAVATEPSVEAICYRLSTSRLQSRPPAINGPALVYVAHRSSDEELRGLDWVRSAFSQHQDDCFAIDVRGIGESLPNTCGMNSFDDPYGCDYFYAAHGIMLDRPYLGQKVHDVLVALRWLDTLGAPAVKLMGSGWGGLIATIAAVLCPKVTSLETQDRVESFQGLATQEYYKMPLAYLPPNVLSEFDLSDCDSELQARGVIK